MAVQISNRVICFMVITFMVKNGEFFHTVSCYGKVKGRKGRSQVLFIGNCMGWPITMRLIRNLGSKKIRIGQDQPA